MDISMINRVGDHLVHVVDLVSQQTGGGIECDVLTLSDGSVLVISEEAVVLYPNFAVWEEGTEVQVGSIPR